MKTWLPVLASLIPFAAFFFLIPYPIYTDSFFYLNVVCHAEPIMNGSLIEPFLFSLIPCNILGIKILLFCLSALSLLAIVKTSAFWHKENAYFSGLFTIAVPFWYIFFFQFENDQFAIPFAFWALFFFVKAKFTGKKANYAISLLFISIAGIIWQASIVLLVALGTMDLFFLLGAYVLTLTQLEQVPYLLFAYTTKASENLFGLAVMHWNWLVFGIVALPSELLWPAAILILAGILNAKLAFFAIPFLAIGWTKAISNITKKNPFKEQKIKRILVIFFVLLQIVSIWPLLLQAPTTWDIQGIKTFIDYKPDILHKNSWSFGHWINFFGGKATAIAGGVWLQDYNHSIVLTEEVLNCPIVLKSRTDITGTPNSFNVYDCP